jgi:hypothetical protein
MRGHVRLRGDVWYAVLSLGIGNERKTVWRSLPECKGKREAETECRRLVREIDTGDFVMTDNSTAHNGSSIGFRLVAPVASAKLSATRLARGMANCLAPTFCPHSALDRCKSCNRQKSTLSIRG